MRNGDDFYEYRFVYDNTTAVMFIYLEENAKISKEILDFLTFS